MNQQYKNGKFDDVKNIEDEEVTVSCEEEIIQIYQTD